MNDDPALPSAGPDRVRIVVPRFGESIVGGAETAMRRLGHSLADRGWRVEVWTTTAVDEATWSTGFATGWSHDGPLRVLRFPVVMRRHPHLFRQLSRLTFRMPPRIRPEHVWTVAQGPYAPGLIRSLARAPAVTTIFSPYLFHTTVYGIRAAHGVRILCPAAHDEPPLTFGVVRRALGAAQALWFNTPEERSLVVATEPAVARTPSRCGVIGVEPPAAVDVDAFRSRHDISGPYVYYGGRVAGGKGFETLEAGAASAHRSAPAVQLVLSGEAGDVAQRDGLRPLGRLTEQERWDAIAGAAAVIVPGRLELLSLLALEAWALGRPCIVNGELPVLAGHIARSGGGLVYSGAEQLAAAIVAIAADPARAAAMGAAGREHVLSTYRWDLSEQRLRELIAEAAL